MGGERVGRRGFGKRGLGGERLGEEWLGEERLGEEWPGHERLGEERLGRGFHCLVACTHCLRQVLGRICRHRFARKSSPQER